MWFEKRLISTIPILIFTQHTRYLISYKIDPELKFWQFDFQSRVQNHIKTN